ncbi:CBM96 family carbohydrate-binding protein [Paenibacillus sp. FSL H8-0034]|uniref:CBM96 family carbohydrate-binding protein n=1 Tax=Paenibacillus sp. FSL H8-0034 TaxID=2954671 RepID=UPI0030F4E8ED
MKKNSCLSRKTYLTGITWNNAPGHAATAASTVNVNGTEASFELDVTSMANSALSGDTVITIVLENTSNQNKYIRFFSKEAVGYPTPCLIIQP